MLLDCWWKSCCWDIRWIHWRFSEDIIEWVTSVLCWRSKGSVSKNSCWVDGSRGRCLLICSGGVCWLRHFGVEVLLEGLLLCFQLFDKRFKVVFWFWVYRRGSGSKLWEGRLLRGVSFNWDGWVLSMLSWDGDRLFWHMLGWRSKIAWTSLSLVFLQIGFVNIESRKYLTTLSWESVMCSVSFMRLLSLVVHVWPDDVDVVDVLFMVTMLSWL